jgi:hypothetical protein
LLRRGRQQIRPPARFLYRFLICGEDLHDLYAAVAHQCASWKSGEASSLLPRVLVNSRRSFAHGLCTATEAERRAARHQSLASHQKDVFSLIPRHVSCFPAFLTPFSFSLTAAGADPCAARQGPCRPGVCHATSITTYTCACPAPDFVSVFKQELGGPECERVLCQGEKRSENANSEQSLRALARHGILARRKRVNAVRPLRKRTRTGRPRPVGLYGSWAQCVTQTGNDALRVPAACIILSTLFVPRT